MLYRKACGKETKLCFGGHILMENRNGLCADFTIHHLIAQPEPAVTLQQVSANQMPRAGVQVKTLGADKAYHWKDFVAACWVGAMGAPCRKERVKVPGMDGRTTAHESYRISQRTRR